MAQYPGENTHPKKKNNLPLKLCSSLINNIKAKQEKVNNANTMVNTLDTYLDLKNYARIHATIHWQKGNHDNIMNDLLVATIITKYHMYKGLKVFG